MISPRKEIIRTEIAGHGGRLGLSGSENQVTSVRHDFSVCLNAFGTSDAVSRAIQSARVDEYPDPYSRVARAAAAVRWSRPVDEIALGAGAAELIHAVCFAYLNPGDRVLIAEPAFAEYERAANLCGARTQTIRPTRNGYGSPDLDSLLDEIRRSRPRIVFLATPVSPTGETVAIEDLRELAEICRYSASLLVLDQAYDAFAEHPLGTPALPDHDHVLHLRSLTKEHALAGIRVAFAVAAPDIVNALERSRVPWAASSIAQAAAVAAMSDDAMAYVAETTRALRAEKSRVVAMCNAMSLSVSSSSTHFITIRCDDGRAARERLLHRHSILVRDCASFGLPEWIRVAARTTTETDALIASLESLLDVSGEFHYLGTIKSS